MGARWDAKGKCKPAVLSTSALQLLPVVLLSPSLVLCPYELPAEPTALHFVRYTQVPAGSVIVDFYFLLSVLKALFYLTVGKWHLNKVVRIQNVKVPRGSVR